MYIYQPKRTLLYDAIRKKADKLHGDILDVGAGEIDRYSHLFANKISYTRFDKKDGDMHLLPFEDASFDGIVCTQVLEYTIEPIVVLQELFRVLKPNGTLLISEGMGTGDLQYMGYTSSGLYELIRKVHSKTIIKYDDFGGFFPLLIQIFSRKFGNTMLRPFTNKLFWLLNPKDKANHYKHTHFVLGTVLTAQKLS